MDVYIWCIILHYGLENAIDIWSFTTLPKTIEQVKETVFENSSSVLHLYVSTLYTIIQL